MDAISKIADSIDRQLVAQPAEVVYCKRCVVSNQRPRITLDEEGVCSACRYTEQKHKYIDWEARGRELEILCDKHRRGDGRYDVVVPSSGGKDSAAVSHMLKHKYGMHPLTVTWAPFEYTEIGYQNFRDYIKSGFNNLMAWPNGNFHRKLARVAFEAVGDPWQPFAFGQMCYAFHIALQFDIPLVFFGENGEVEYGGSTKNRDRPFFPVEDWAEHIFKGVTVDDMVVWGRERGLLTEQDYDATDLTFYRPPAIDQIRDKGLVMHWWSYYNKWTPQENYYYAVEHTGFHSNPERTEGTYSKYASIDDRLDGFHFYLAFIKFGIGRATSDAAHEVRDGHLTREEAVALVQRYDGEFPAKYFKDFLEYLDITEEKFWEITDTYRRPHLWTKVDGAWKLKHRVS